MEEKEKRLNTEQKTKVSSTFERDLKQTIQKGSLTAQNQKPNKSLQSEKVHSTKKEGSTAQEVKNTPIKTNSSDSAQEFEQEKRKTFTAKKASSSAIKRRRMRTVEPTNHNNIMEVANKQKLLKELNEAEKNNGSIKNISAKSKQIIKATFKKDSLLNRLDRGYDNLPNSKGVRALRSLDERINHKLVVERIDGIPKKKGIRLSGSLQLSSSLRLDDKIKRKIEKLNVANENTSTLQSGEKARIHKSGVKISGRVRISNQAKGAEQTATSSYRRISDTSNAQKARLITRESKALRVEGKSSNVGLSQSRIRVTRKGLINKTRVYSEKRYNQLYNPSLKRQLGTGVLNNTKESITGTGRLMTEQSKTYLTKNLNQEGIGGQVAATYVQAPAKVKQVVKTVNIVNDGAIGASKLIWNGNKSIATGAYKTGYLAKEGVKELRRNGFKKTFGKLGKNTMQQISSIPEKALKKIANIAKESLKQIVMKVLPAVGGIMIFIIFLSLIVSMISQVTGAGIEVEVLADSNSIISTKLFLDDMKDEWNDRMEQIKKSFLIVTNCEFGNNDTVEVIIKNESEDDENGVETEIKNEYLALYCMLATKYDLKIQNLGVDRGNTVIDAYVDAEILREDLIKWFYFLNPIELSEMEVEQKKFKCSHGALHHHAFHHTTITVHLRTVSDLIISEGFTDEQIAIFNKLYNDLITEGYNSGTPLEWKDSFNGTGGGSSFDGMSKDVWIEYWENDVPVLNVTRQEFIDMVKGICIPTGKIQYVWGGKNISSGGLDCSGFSKAMFMELGIDIGNGTAGQWANTKAISSSEAKPGDLVFKQMPSSSGINHVGIFLGNNNPEGKFAHCAGSSGTIVNSYKGFVFYRRPMCKFKDDVKTN